MTRKGCLGCLGLIVLVLGWLCLPDPIPERARTILDAAEQLELFSMGRGEARDPTRRDGYYQSGHDVRKLLGRALVTGAEKAELLAVIRGGMRVGKVQFFGISCHYPHHLVKASAGNRTLTISICFECHNIDFDEGEDSVHFQNFSGDRDRLNRILTRHNVPLPPAEEYPH